MRIAVLGAGMVGGTLGERFAQVGHEVYFGVPSPQDEKIRELLSRIGSKARAGLVSEAARDAEIVVLATPWDAVPSAIVGAGDLAGKIVIDCTNPLGKTDGGLGLLIGHTSSGAEQVAAWATGAHVCKAFNQTGYANMAEPRFAQGSALMFVCGDDPGSREVVQQLVASIGFDAVDAGGLKIARLLEPLAMLWIHLSLTTELKRDFAFALLRR